MKNTLKGINNRLKDLKEGLTDLEGRMRKITQSEQQKEKQV